MKADQAISECDRRMEELFQPERKETAAKKPPPRCILNMRSARQYALDCGAISHPGQFSRVSAEWLSQLEERLKFQMDYSIRALPSVGKTIK